MPNGQTSRAHLDAVAQGMGFKDYNHWAAWNQNTRQVVLSPGPAGTDGSTPPQNWLQHLLSSIPATPAYLLNKVNDALGNATGGQ